MPQLEQGAGPSGRHPGLLPSAIHPAGELLMTCGVIVLLFVAWHVVREFAGNHSGGAGQPGHRALQGTAMPGAVGNFAMAGHRQTHGAVLDNIDALVPGDQI